MTAITAAAHADPLSMTSETKDGNSDKGFYPRKVMTFPMPADILVLVQARKLAADQSNRLEEFTLCVCQDPVLVVELFKAANSVYIGGGRNSLTSVQAAITRLGTARTLGCLDELSERQSIDNIDVRKWFETHRSRGKRTAIVARMLGQLLAKSFANECQLGGLLSSVGDMLAVLYLQEKYVDLAEKNAQATVTYKLVQEYKYDADKIGPEYLLRNGVPQELVAAIEGASSGTKESKFAVLKPIVAAAAELVDAFDSGRWDKVAPGRTLSSKSNIRLLQFSDERQYSRLYERASEYLFAVRTLEHKQNAAGEQLVEAARAELKKSKGTLPPGVTQESGPVQTSSAEEETYSPNAVRPGSQFQEPEESEQASIWSIKYSRDDEKPTPLEQTDQSDSNEDRDASTSVDSDFEEYDDSQEYWEEEDSDEFASGAGDFDVEEEVGTAESQPSGQGSDETEPAATDHEHRLTSQKQLHKEPASTLIDPGKPDPSSKDHDFVNYKKQDDSSQSGQSQASQNVAHTPGDHAEFGFSPPGTKQTKARQSRATEKNRAQTTEELPHPSQKSASQGRAPATKKVAPKANRNIHPSKLIALEKAAETISAMSQRMDSAKNSEELLANILVSLVDDGPFEKTALVVISEDRRHALVVAARGPNIGNGQRLVLDDPLSPLSQCLSKIQSFGKEESSTSPFGSKTFAVAPIDADHSTPVALYADCGNEGSITFEARRIFRTVVTLINERLKTLPGGIPNELGNISPPAS